MNDRYLELDSLRGIAALSVFFSHIYLLFHESTLSTFLFKYGPLRALVAGSEAVIFFFVLSGFVLSIPFYSGRRMRYRDYVFKRVCRIYIPFIVSILIGSFAHELFYSSKIEGLTNWFNDNWSTQLNLDSAIDHLILIGTFTSSINNVVWSLVHEMRISLFFPLIMFLLLKIDTVKGIGLAILFSSISLMYYNLTNASFSGTEVFATVHYSAMFIVGALLSKHKNEISDWIVNIRIKYKILFLVSGIITYLYLHPSFLLNLIFINLDPYLRTVIDTWFVSLGACILIITGISFYQIKSILNNKVINYLGKISYSLYLTHIAVLFSCVHLLYGKVNMVFISLIAIVVTIAVSSLMYSFIEKPSMKLGRTLSKNNKESIFKTKVTMS